jgi:hypothetical protein
MLVIKELLFDRPREEYVAARITGCPADVELHTVASWLSQRYGAPIDEARSVDPKVGEIVVGWVYRVPSGWPDADPATQELVAMPMQANDDGEPGDSAFLVQAEIRQWMRAVAEREGIPLEVWRLEQTEYEPKQSRGDQEPPDSRATSVSHLLAR